MCPRLITNNYVGGWGIVGDYGKVRVKRRPGPSIAPHGDQVAPLMVGAIDKQSAHAHVARVRQGLSSIPRQTLAALPFHLECPVIAPIRRGGKPARYWRAGQEQTQIIKTANGRPTPRALPIVNANAEIKSVSNSRPDMTHSKEPPRALLVAQRMNDQKARRSSQRAFARIRPS
jgi:hypothetical protein